MAPKRKSDASEGGEGSTAPPAKAAKTNSGAKTADKLNLTAAAFESGAPNLGASIYTTGLSRGSDLLTLDLTKQKMSSGSFGWVGAGKKISVEIEVDGEKKLVQAQVTLNVTVVGSKKMTEGEGKSKGEGSSKAKGNSSDSSA